VFTARLLLFGLFAKHTLILPFYLPTTHYTLFPERFTPLLLSGNVFLKLNVPISEIYLQYYNL